MKQDSDCLYCGEEDSINHTFIHCRFTQSFQENAFNWFNSANDSNLRPSTKESLFGISLHSSTSKTLIKKLNYTLLFKRFYIYSCKLHNKSMTLSDERKCKRFSTTLLLHCCCCFCALFFLLSILEYLTCTLVTFVINNS